MAGCEGALNPPVVYSAGRSGGGGPGVGLTLCCFVVYSTRRFVVCLSVCHFVLVFFSPFSIAITSLGEEICACLGFVGFLFLLVSGKGCVL